MLCCLGLFAGSALGSMVGGPWRFITPTAGFGLGLLADAKLMRGSYRSHGGFRGGCCRGGHAHEDEVEERSIDPVCGMAVERKTASYEADFRGKTYFFCSQACMSTFKGDPGRYTK